MTGITQGSSFRDTQSNSQALGSSSTPSASSTSVLTKTAVSGANYQQNNLLGNKEQLLNLLAQLVEQIGKWQGGGSTKPQSKPLELSKKQDQNIRKRFGISGEMNYQVLDSKRDGKLSAGDTLVVSGGITGGEISRQKLTQKDVDAINGKGTSDAQTQLDANRKKWASQDIDDYSFTLQRSCFCRGDAIRPINIEVRDGEVSSARYADTGELIPDDSQYNKQSVYNLNADGLFNLVEQGIKSGAEKVDVSYDKTYGLPTSIYIDQSTQIADEEMGYTISNFRPEPTYTTLACGEEGNDCNPIDPLPPVEPPIGSTKRLGEEGDPINPGPIKPPIEPPTVTTMAWGEEGGGYLGPPIQIKPPVDDDPIATTQAVGEEDGSNKHFLY